MNQNSLRNLFSRGLISLLFRLKWNLSRAGSWQNSQIPCAEFIIAWTCFGLFFFNLSEKYALSFTIVADFVISILCLTSASTCIYNFICTVNFACHATTVSVWHVTATERLFMTQGAHLFKPFFPPLHLLYPTSFVIIPSLILCYFPSFV